MKVQRQKPEGADSGGSTFSVKCLPTVERAERSECVKGWESTGKLGCGAALRALLQLGAVNAAWVLVIGQLSAAGVETMGLT